MPPLPFKEGGNGSGTSLGRFRREVAKHERYVHLATEARCTLWMI